MSVDAVGPLMQEAQTQHRQLWYVGGMHLKKDNLVMAWDRVFNLLLDFCYCQENKTYRFNLLFLKIPNKIVGT